MPPALKSIGEGDDEAPAPLRPPTPRPRTPPRPPSLPPSAAYSSRPFCPSPTPNTLAATVAATVAAVASPRRSTPAWSPSIFRRLRLRLRLRHRLPRRVRCHRRRRRRGTSTSFRPAAGLAGSRVARVAGRQNVATPAGSRVAKIERGRSLNTKTSITVHLGGIEPTTSRVLRDFSSYFQDTVALAMSKRVYIHVLIHSLILQSKINFKFQSCEI